MAPSCAYDDSTVERAIDVGMDIGMVTLHNIQVSAFQCVRFYTLQDYAHFLFHLFPVDVYCEIKSDRMNAEHSLFVHWNTCPRLAPFSHYLREVGCLKFSGIDPHSLDMHYNEGIELNYVVKGTYKWIVEGKRYQLFPGEAFITCPWERHGSPDEVLDRGILSWMILKPRSFSRSGQLDLGDWSRLSRDIQGEAGMLFAHNANPVLPRGNGLIEIFRKLHQEIDGREMGYEEQIHLLLDALVIRLARILKRRKCNKERDERFVEMLTATLEEDLCSKFNVAELAWRFNMSPSSFNSKVKASTGFSPADYLIELRLAAAKELLLAGRESITEIAALCGFCSSQYFATLFSRRVGVSPSRFRREGRPRNQENAQSRPAV